MAQNRTGIKRMMQFSDLSYEQIKFCLFAIHLNVPDAAHYADTLIDGFRRVNPQWFHPRRTD